MNTKRAIKKYHKYFDQLRCDWCNVYQDVDHAEYKYVIDIKKNDGSVTIRNKQKDAFWLCQREKCIKSRVETL